MDDATAPPRASPFAAFLAGLQSGMLGVLWMLAWLGLSAAWQQRSFWTAENLMASVFYGANAIRRGFAGETLAGTAVYLALYSLLGAFLAMALRDRLPRARTYLVAMVFALGWYYLSFHWIWKSVMPLVALLHVERSTAFGHLVYGAVLGRYPVYLRKVAAAPPPNENAVGRAHEGPPPETTPTLPQSSSPPDPASQSGSS